MLNSSIEIISFVFNWLATIVTIGCYLPQTIKTMITKHTYDLSKWFFILGFASSILWIIGSIISIFVYKNQGMDISNILLLTLPVIFTNVIGTIANLIVLIIKINNVTKAKKAQLSEKEYCNNKYKKHNNKVDKL